MHDGYDDSAGWGSVGGDPRESVKEEAGERPGEEPEEGDLAAPWADHLQEATGRDQAVAVGRCEGGKPHINASPELHPQRMMTLFSPIANWKQ